MEKRMSHELNEKNFETMISSGVTLVDFHAPWCGPCRMQTPVLEKVSARFTDKAKVGSINVDENPYIASKFGIRSIPTLILFNNGVPVKQFVGLQSENTLVNALNEAVK